MRKPSFILSFFFLLSSSFPLLADEKSANETATTETADAQNSALTQVELLDLPAYKSKLASKSIVMSLTSTKDGVLVVGERGHILLWNGDDNWQQQTVPVSVAITNATTLSDGSKIAVGHDSVILKSDSTSNEWVKVFTGWELTDLKIAAMQVQQVALEKVIENTSDEDELDELTYQLDDIIFGIEDAELEKTAGPNQPLLSVVSTKDDTLFAVGAYGLFLTSKDKGKTWQFISNRLENPDKFHLNDIIYTADNHLFIVGENGLGFHSSNNGDDWELIDMPYTGSIFGIISNPNAPEELVAFGLQGNIMVSSNRGKSWDDEKLPTSASFLGGTFLASGQAVVVGHGGRVVSLYVNDLAGLKVQQHPSGAAFSSVLEQNQYLVLGGQYGVELWKPSDNIKLSPASSNIDSTDAGSNSADESNAAKNNNDK
ncbi:MAG: WD40/YVTN/BNR-like repeat-containing protein [Colwellia sp.]